MGLILDTHTLIWFNDASPRLSEATKNKMAALEAPTYVSIISYWEMAIKIKLNKLNIDGSLSDFIAITAEAGVQLLPLNVSHILKLQTLELHHHDPFDRLLIAQALVEGFTLVSCDSHFTSYDVPILW